jgi:AcrR family transcriptional regulator
MSTSTGTVPRIATSTPSLNHRPHGRTEVVNALLDAATTLFAAHGPGAVSLRDVAREANVNLGLIHRYIGGKQDLLGMVLERRPGMPALPLVPTVSTEELVDLVLELVVADPLYTRIVLRATLDGFDVPNLQQAFPLIERAVSSARSSLPTPDAEVRVGTFVATVLGWQALSSLLLEILGLSELDPAQVARMLRPAVLAFLQAPPP